MVRHGFCWFVCLLVMGKEFIGLLAVDGQGVYWFVCLLVCFVRLLNASASKRADCPV
jgi:hypothetical protein